MARPAGFAQIAARTGLLGALLLAAPAYADDVRIGLAVPLTGRAAGDGLAMERALKEAVAEANAAGGLGGRSLVLETEDDGCATATGEGAARVLAAKPVAVVIGHPCSSAATGAVPVYAAAGVLLIAVGARHPLVTDVNPAAPVLRLAGRDDRQGAAAADWLKAHAKEGRIAIVHDRTGYARAIADGAVAALQAAGIVPVTIVGLVAGHHAYDEALDEIGKTRAEAVLFAGYPEEAQIVSDGLRARGAVIPLIGSDSLATPQFAAVAAKAKSPVEVLLPVEPPSIGQDGRSAAALAVRAKGALEAWLATARAQGTTDGAAITKALRGGAAETATLGTIHFDAHGDIEGAAFTATPARGGQWTAGERSAGAR